MKREPLRQCIVCRRSSVKKDLFRVVKDAAGNAVWDFEYRAKGRGYYLCKDFACIHMAIKRRQISKVLNIEISSEFYEEALEWLENNRTNGSEVRI